MAIVKDPLNLPAVLDVLINLASRIDKRLSDRERYQTRPGFYHSAPPRRENCREAASPSSSSSSPGLQQAEEPMQIGQTKLSPAEGQCRMNEGRAAFTVGNWDISLLTACLRRVMGTQVLSPGEFCSS